MPNMKTISKANLTLRHTICTRLIHAYGDLENALSHYNDVLEREWHKVYIAIAAYNSILD